MSERAPDTQIEVVVGILPNREKDFVRVLTDVSEKSYFDVLVAIKDARERSSVPKPWAAVIPEYNQQTVAGKGSVINTSETLKTMDGLDRLGVRLHANVTSKGYEPSHIISDEAIILTNVEDWRGKLRDKSGMTKAEIQDDEEKSGRFTFKDGLKLSRDDFVGRVVWDTEQLISDLENGQYSVSDEYRAQVLANLYESRGDLAKIAADVIYDSLKRLEPFIIPTEPFMQKAIAKDRRILVASSYDVSNDVIEGSDILKKHLADHYLPGSDLIHVPFSFIGPNGTMLDVPRTADDLRFVAKHGPHRIVGMNFHGLPLLGDSVEFIAAYNKGNREMTAEGPNPYDESEFSDGLIARLPIGDEDIRFIKTREGLSPKTERVISYIEDIIDLGKITIHGLNSKITEPVIPVGRPTHILDLEKQIEEHANTEFDYTNAPSVHDDPEIAKLLHSEDVAAPEKPTLADIVRAVAEEDQQPDITTENDLLVEPDTPMLDDAQNTTEQLGYELIPRIELSRKDFAGKTTDEIEATIKVAGAVQQARETYEAEAERKTAAKTPAEQQGSTVEDAAENSEKPLSYENLTDEELERLTQPEKTDEEDDDSNNPDADSDQYHDRN